MLQADRHRLVVRSEASFPGASSLAASFQVAVHPVASFLRGASFPVAVHRVASSREAVHPVASFPAASFPAAVHPVASFREAVHPAASSLEVVHPAAFLQEVPAALMEVDLSEDRRADLWVDPRVVPWADWLVGVRADPWAAPREVLRGALWADRSSVSSEPEALAQVR